MVGDQSLSRRIDKERKDKARDVHHLLRLQNPKSHVCSECGRRAPTQWALRNHAKDHTTNIEDYAEMCTRCHMGLDALLKRIALKMTFGALPDTTTP